MEKLSIKKALLDLCKDAQDNTISNLQKEMSDSQQNANDYGQEQDLYDPHRTQLLSKRDLFAGQLKKAMDERNILERIQTDRINDTVEFGSVVITNEQNLFISISTGKITLNEKTFYAISPKVPFFQSMQGKHKGEAFHFRDKDIKIQDVF